VSLSPFGLDSTSDHALLEGLKKLAALSVGLEADLLVHWGEVESRGLALELGFRSLFSYCVEVLHFSESVAFHRITAARAARRFPQILERLRSGELHLSGLRLLLPQLTAENCVELLDLARHQSKRAIEERLADRAPKPDAKAVLRRRPERVAVSEPLVLDSPAPPPPLRSQRRASLGGAAAGSRQGAVHGGPRRTQTRGRRRCCATRSPTAISVESSTERSTRCCGMYGA
jgi:hypothetical protein